MHGNNDWFSPPILILVKSFGVPDIFKSIKKPILSRLENELDPRLGYHNLSHTLDVLEQAERIARQENISDEHDLLLLKIAALFHDSGFLIIYRNHEEKSCEIALESLQNLLSKEDIKKICGMIMATKIPQTPHTLLEQIICDADLDYLGRNDFEPVSRNLYKEFLTFKIIPEDIIWDHIQIKFFESHHYFTGTSMSKRNKKKLKHLQILKERSNWAQ
ncbi:MAG TPA: HD domain-containing protein [Chitinophagaceae bacterium]|nr:HD domain-containing protein [Chitinophagaceae bacterium]